MAAPNAATPACAIQPWLAPVAGSDVRAGDAPAAGADEPVLVRLAAHTAPLGRRTAPVNVSWAGCAAVAGTVGSCTIGCVWVAVVPGVPVMVHSVSTRGSARLGTMVSKSVGTVASGLAARFKADVKSPTRARRQALRPGWRAAGSWFGIGAGLPLAAAHVSTNRNSDVWSNRSEHTSGAPAGLGFRLNGEITSIGTRKPRPMGSAEVSRPPTVVASCLAVAVMAARFKYSPGVPAGAVGGGTWSKNPPFSS